jgi:hypothetical protein
MFNYRQPTTNTHVGCIDNVTHPHNQNVHIMVEIGVW